MTVSLKHTTPADGTFSSAGAVAWDAEHTLTLATGNLLGRSTAGTGAAEEISIGTGLSLSGGTLTNTVTATAPGGSTTQIQYNNAGSFAGASGLTTNGTELTIASGTKTASAPVMDMTQTWNNGAVTFTSLQLNVTNTASASGSKLLNLQLGGASVFEVSASNSISAAYVRIRGGGQNLVGLGSLNTSVPSIVVQSTGGFGWSVNADAFSGVYDLILSRRGAANLRFGAADAAAPVAQTLSVQSVVAGTSNTAGANLTITGSQGTGTGAGGSIIFQVAPAGSSGPAQNALQNAFFIAQAGSGQTEVRSVNTGGGSANVTIATTANTNTTVTYKFSAGADGTGGSTAGYTGRISGNIGVFDGSGALIVGAPSGSLDSVGIRGTDVRLARDAADTLALRNGTNAQTFRVYKTYTDASNYQRVALYASAGGNIVLEQQVAGTGVATDFYIGNSSGSSNVIIQTGAGIARWKWDSNGHFLANADNTYDIGASGANRPRSIYAGTGFVGNLSTGSGAYSSVGAFGFYSVNSGSGGSTNGFNFARDGSTNGVCLFRNGPETDSGFLVFGTARNTSFPALKRSSAVLQVRLSDDSSYTAVEASTVRTATAYTVATLPAAGTAGRRAYVTDATAPTFLGTLTGGGAVVCPVFDDGTNWVAA